MNHKHNSQWIHDRLKLVLIGTLLFLPIGTSDAADPDPVSITIGSAGKVTGGNVKIKLTGNLTNNGSFTDQNGTVELVGALAQTLGGSSVTEFNHLTVNNSAGVTLNQGIKIGGTLTLTNGTLDLNDNDLTFGSNGRFEAEGNGSLSGDITAQAEITGSGEHWRMLSSPIASTYSDFLENIWTQGPENSDQEASAGDGNVFTYDENTTGSLNDGWTMLPDMNTNFTAGKGFIVYMFADDDNNGIDDEFPKTIDVKGNENDGTIDFPLTYTDTGNAANDGWNLLGNPWITTIDWDNFTKINVNNVVYVWDSASGAYKSWNGTTGDLTDGLISSFQGFFVQANAASPSLQAGKLNVESIENVQLARTNNDLPILKFQLQKEERKENTYIMFSETASAGLDPYDAYQLAPLSKDYISLFTRLENGIKLDINNLPLPQNQEKVDIALDIVSTDEGLYTLTWPELENIPANWTLSLTDHEANQIIDILETESYVFHYSKRNEKKKKEKTRFTLQIQTDVSNTNFEHV